MDRDTLEQKCFENAHRLSLMGYYPNMDVFEITDLLIKLECEKIEKDSLHDKLLNFNDVIVSMENMGQMETTDISVTGDNLFFCNGLLTKNSFGTPMTADVQLAIYSTPELEVDGKIMVKQLKNRYNATAANLKFMLNIDRDRMKLWDSESFAQSMAMPSGDNSVVKSNTDSNRSFQQFDFTESE